MAIHTIYDPASGAIIGHIDGGDYEMSANVPPGLATIEGHFDGATQCIRGGAPIARMPDPPPAESYAHRRHRAYPPLQDFADAFYWLAKGDPNPMRQWVEAIDIVKSNHPKESPDARA